VFLSDFNTSDAVVKDVKGGASTISTFDTSFTSGKNRSINSRVSEVTLFIFQFAAIKGFRILIL
jgi:hypothetical protein